MQVNDCGNQLGLLSVKQPGMLFIIFLSQKMDNKAGQENISKPRCELRTFSYFFGLLIFWGGAGVQPKKPIVANTHICQ